MLSQFICLHDSTWTTQRFSGHWRDGEELWDEYQNLKNDIVLHGKFLWGADEAYDDRRNVLVLDKNKEWYWTEKSLEESVLFLSKNSISLYFTFFGCLQDGVCGFEATLVGTGMAGETVFSVLSSGTLEKWNTWK